MLLFQHPGSCPACHWFQCPGSLVRSRCCDALHQVRHHRSLLIFFYFFSFSPLFSRRISFSALCTSLITLDRPFPQQEPPAPERYPAYGAKQSSRWLHLIYQYFLSFPATSEYVAFCNIRLALLAKTLNKQSHLLPCHYICAVRFIHSSSV